MWGRDMASLLRYEGRRRDVMSRWWWWHVGPRCHVVLHRCHRRDTRGVLGRRVVVVVACGGAMLRLRGTRGGAGTSRCGGSGGSKRGVVVVARGAVPRGCDVVVVMV